MFKMLKICKIKWFLLLVFLPICLFFVSYSLPVSAGGFFHVWFRNVHRVMSNQEQGFLPPPKGFATKAIHAFHESEQWESMALVPPLVTSTCFEHYGPGELKKYDYGRYGNPSREILENCLAALEDAKYGLCFASGIGSILAVSHLLQTGDHVLCSADVFGGTSKLFNVTLKGGIECTNVSALDEALLEKSIKPNTKLIWMETPTNPILKVIDIATISRIAKKNNILLAVDNTFLTSYFQRPLDFGADVVVYSISKYINGHTDVIMGAVVTNRQDIYDKLKIIQIDTGIIPSPFDCYQVTRSLKTLALRMEQHSKSSLTIAKFLENHPKIEKVSHPGLPSHPQHELAKRQTSGHSGVLAVNIKGGLEKSRMFLGSLKVFRVASSLGGYESVAGVPVLMSHVDVSEDERKTMGIRDSLVRISVGLENTEDLIDDLSQALEKI